MYTFIHVCIATTFTTAFDNACQQVNNLATSKYLRLFCQLYAVHPSS